MKKHRQLRKRLAWINLVVFGTVLTVAGVLFFALPKINSSVVENRRLTQFPQFSWHSFFEGKFTDSLDQYMADHFAFREQLVSTSFQLAEWRGIQNNETQFYDFSKRIAGDNHADTAIVVEKNGDLLISFVVHNGMAIPYFKGRDDLASKYAQAINKFRKQLPDSVAIYTVIAPSHCELYMPSKYMDQVTSEKKHIDLLYSNLSKNITPVDVTTTMLAHKSEYVFFRTDHHWTATGAYYAYAETIKQCGMLPVELSQFESKQKNNWLGSNYALTRSDLLENNPDTVIWYLMKKPLRVWRYYDSLITTPVVHSLYSENPGYGVFLGGDFPLMKIETLNRNRRNIVIVKNSFGNAFAPFFTNHFENVYIIDYRYFSHNLSEFVAANKITDVVFVSGSLAANTHLHISQIEKLTGYQSKTMKK